METPPRTTVLFVCLGNICRSPAAEGIFLHLLEKRCLTTLYQVDSAGTGSWHVGEPADRRMQQAATRRGITLPSRARQVQRHDLDRFDWILAMDNNNLAALRDLDPDGRCHHKIVAMASLCRHHEAHEVPDPYFGGAHGFDHVLDLLDDACAALLDSLENRRQVAGGSGQAPRPTR